MMLYVIRVCDDKNQTTFRFNGFSDMSNFLATVTETADGFEEGKTRIIVSREEDEKSPF